MDVLEWEKVDEGVVVAVHDAVRMTDVDAEVQKVSVCVIVRVSVRVREAV